MAFEPDRRTDRDAEEETQARGNRRQAAACVDVLVLQGQSVADAIGAIGVTEVTD
jgi:hypothetical protein